MFFSKMEEVEQRDPKNNEIQHNGGSKETPNKPREQPTQIGAAGQRNKS